MTLTKEAAREKELREKLEKIIESGDEDRIELLDKIFTEFILLDLILSQARRGRNGGLRVE